MVHDISFASQSQIIKKTGTGLPPQKPDQSLKKMKVEQLFEEVLDVRLLGAPSLLEDGGWTIIVLGGPQVGETMKILR